MALGKDGIYFSYVISAFSLLQLGHTCFRFLCRPNWQDFSDIADAVQKKQVSQLIALFGLLWHVFLVKFFIWRTPQNKQTLRTRLSPLTLFTGKTSFLELTTQYFIELFCSVLLLHLLLVTYLLIYFIPFLTVLHFISNSASSRI